MADYARIEFVVSLNTVFQLKQLLHYWCCWSFVVYLCRVYAVLALSAISKPHRRWSCKSYPLMRSQTIDKFNQSSFQILRISASYTWYVIFDANMQEVKFLKFSGWLIICFFQNILDIFWFNFSVCNIRLFDLDKRLNIMCSYFHKVFSPNLRLPFRYIFCWSLYFTFFPPKFHIYSLGWNKFFEVF